MRKLASVLLIGRSFSAHAKVQFPTDADLQGIRNLCAGGDVQAVDGKLSGALSVWKRSPEASIDVVAAKRNLGAVLDKVTADVAGNALYREYVLCVRGLVEKFLTRVNPIQQSTKSAGISAGSNSQEITQFADNNSGAVVQGNNNSVQVNKAPTIEIAEAAADSPLLTFIFGTWCDRIDGKVFFRKDGKDIFYRYVAPAIEPMPGVDNGAPAVDTGYVPANLKIVTFPDRTWGIQRDEQDGSQTIYHKQNNTMMYSRSTIHGRPIMFNKCE